MRGLAWWLEAWRQQYRTLRVDWVFREYGGHRGAGYIIAKAFAEAGYTPETLRDSWL